MEDLTKKQQFVELRAKGKSFAKISEELEVSKTTLIDWSKDLSDQISNFGAIEIEALREEYKISREHRVKLYGEQLKAIREELSTRRLDNIPTDKLIGLLFKLSDIIGKEDVRPVFSKTSSSFSKLDYDSTDTWSV